MCFFQYSKLNNEQAAELERIARLLQTDPAWLYQLIDFESGWNPAAKNPYSSASGLIQFIDKTARSLGYSSSADLVRKNPTIEDQLKSPVYRYLSQFSPFPTLQSLTMAVFYPEYRSVSPNTSFPDTVKINNPGINSPRDYMMRVIAKSLIVPGSVVVLFAAAGLFILHYLQKGVHV